MSAPRQRFRRAAERRTNRALKALRLLSRCANRTSYEYTAREAEAILTAVERAVEECKSHFDEEPFHL